MKLTVDTKEDSTEDIRHMIKMLTALVESRGGVSSYSGDSGGVMNMFDSDSSTSSSTGTPDPSTETAPSMFNMFQDEKKDDDEVPKVMEY